MFCPAGRCFYRRKSDLFLRHLKAVVGVGEDVSGGEENDLDLGIYVLHNISSFVLPSALDGNGFGFFFNR